MNWLFTKKRRAQERVLQAVGAHQGTEDEIFIKKYSEFKSYTVDVQRCHDAFLLAIDSIDIYSNSCLCTGDAFKQLHFNNNNSNNTNNNTSNNTNANKAQNNAMKMGVISDLNYNIGYDINEHLHSNIRILLIEKCVKPTAYILNQLPAIDAKVAERKRILLDYDYWKAKLQSQHASLSNTLTNTITNSVNSVSGTSVQLSDNYAKIAEKLNEKMLELAQVQIDVEIAIEEFEDAKTTMLAPEIAVYNACMYYFATSNAILYSQLFTFLPQSQQTLDQLVSTTGISTVQPRCFNNSEAIVETTIYNSGTGNGNSKGTGTGDGDDSSFTNPSNNTPSRPISMLSPMQHSYCKIQSLVHTMMLDLGIDGDGADIGSSTSADMETSADSNTNTYTDSNTKHTSDTVVDAGADTDNDADTPLDHSQPNELGNTVEQVDVNTVEKAGSEIENEIDLGEGNDADVCVDITDTNTNTIIDNVIDNVTDTTRVPSDPDPNPDPNSPYQLSMLLSKYRMDPILAYMRRISGGIRTTPESI